MKKVIQYKARCGWNRATADDIRDLLKNIAAPLKAFFKKRRSKFASTVVIDRGDGRRFEIRFASIGKCREESYLPFSMTERYRRMVEEDAGIF